MRLVAMKPGVLLLVCVCLVRGDTFYSISDEYTYWRHPNITSTQLFAIDHENRQLILAAENSACHLSLDLTQAYNIRDAAPTEYEAHVCQTDGDIFQSASRCQNFHHVLLFPRDKDQTIITDDTNITVPVTDTVLACGSNAFQPRCFYRNKTDLTILANYSAVDFCAYDPDSITTSIISSTGELVSGTLLDFSNKNYGVTRSTSPFTGPAFLGTIEGNNLMFNTPALFDIYERENSYYLFMREKAVETQSQVIYSRVARICKNDQGVSDGNKEVFTTYLKARIVCQSRGSDSSIPYNYNDLEDTVLISNNASVNQISGEHLYGIFTSAENGPIGSSLCVYGFGNTDTDSLQKVFEGKYLENSALNEFTEVDNLAPVDCSNSNPTRVLDEAETHVLMANVVVQDGDPLLKDDGILFKRLAVDLVKDVTNTNYEVLLITAIRNDELELLVMTHIPERVGDDTVVSRRVTLARGNGDATGQQVGKMEIYKDNSEISVYVSTDHGLYVVPLSNCSIYTSCSECMSARDPYCAYSMDLDQCVSLHDSTRGNVIQDIVNGSSKECPSIMPTTTSSIDAPISTEMTELIPTCSNAYIVSTVIATTTVTETPLQTREVQPSPTRSASPPVTSTSTVFAVTSPIEVRPTIGGVSEDDAGSDMTIWIIVAGCGGLIVGVVIGLLFYAMMRNRNKFCWGKLLTRNNRYDFSDGEEKINRQYGNNDMELKTMYNNSMEANGKVASGRPSTPPLTKLNPTNPGSQLPRKVTDSPILSKYSSPDRKHHRSQSSGGPYTFPGFEPMGNAPPTVGSPMGNNLRETFHIEESVSNSERQKYGKNVVGRQLSKEYPMLQPTAGTHFKSCSLDLDHDYFNQK